MKIEHLQCAVELYKINHDPLLLDAVRVIADKNSPEQLLNTTLTYIERSYDAALLFFANSDTHRLNRYSFGDAARDDHTDAG